LSLVFCPPNSVLSSGADSVLARHPLSAKDGESPLAGPDKVVQTKHTGQTSLMVRSDGKLFLSAGWDGRGRVYSVKSMKELACLKWHRDGRLGAAAFAEILDRKDLRNEKGR